LTCITARCARVMPPGANRLSQAPGSAYHHATAGWFRVTFTVARGNLNVSSAWLSLAPRDGDLCSRADNTGRAAEDRGSAWSHAGHGIGMRQPRARSDDMYALTITTMILYAYCKPPCRLSSVKVIVQPLMGSKLPLSLKRRPTRSDVSTTNDSSSHFRPPWTGRTRSGPCPPERLPPLSWQVGAPSEMSKV
jgi:hypothetical protein